MSWMGYGHFLSVLKQLFLISKFSGNLIYSVVKLWCKISNMYANWTRVFTVNKSVWYKIEHTFNSSLNNLSCLHYKKRQFLSNSLLSDATDVTENTSREHFALFHIAAPSHISTQKHMFKVITFFVKKGNLGLSM